MNEPLFGSMTPVWSAATYPPLGWQQTPFGSRAMASTVPGVTASGAGFASGIPSVMSSPGGLSASIYAPSSGMPVGASGPAFAGSEVAIGVPVSALLATVAVRRGQPLGPTNDQEIEDFIYDACELLPGSSEVDVRCEGGRVELSANALRLSSTAPKPMTVGLKVTPTPLACTRTTSCVPFSTRSASTVPSVGSASVRRVRHAGSFGASSPAPDSAPRCGSGSGSIVQSSFALESLVALYFTNAPETCTSKALPR